MNKVAKFEKVSFEEFFKAYVSQNPDTNIEIVKRVYNDIILPQRSTTGSAGYDFYSPDAFKIKNGETVLVPTGIKARMTEGWVLMLAPRSSMGFKFRLQLDNTIGIIDSDYYNNEDNEGHIFIKISCDAYKETEILIKKGQGFAQGLFIPFGITEDDNAIDLRNGGIGSTDNKK